MRAGLQRPAWGFLGEGADQAGLSPPLTSCRTTPAVSLELGDVSLVSVPALGLQPAPDTDSRGQLLGQLQELLHHWVLWSAVKSRWVIVGECMPLGHPCTPLHPRTGRTVI